MRKRDTQVCLHSGKDQTVPDLSMSFPPPTKEESEARPAAEEEKVRAGVQRWKQPCTHCSNPSAEAGTSHGKERLYPSMKFSLIIGLDALTQMG